MLSKLFVSNELKFIVYINRSGTKFLTSVLSITLELKTSNNTFNGLHRKRNGNYNYYWEVFKISCISLLDNMHATETIGKYFRLQIFPIVISNHNLN